MFPVLGMAPFAIHIALLKRGDAEYRKMLGRKLPFLAKSSAKLSRVKLKKIKTKS